MAERPLYPIRRNHLEALTGELGIWQHATRTIPNEEFGYSIDDVARALAVDLLHGGELGWSVVHTSAWRSIRFMRDAFDPVTGRFRNFRTADGAWLETAGSEDCHGRALLGLGLALAGEHDAAFVHNARTLFAAALPAAGRLHDLRASSSALLACAAALDGSALDGGLRDETRRSFERLASHLREAFGSVDLDGDWPWPEEILTYENGLLAHALLVAGRRLPDAGLRRTGLRVLDWLIRVQTTAAGSFSPIGSAGWWRRGGERSQFDQQPIEATSMILAEEAAFAETGERRYSAAAESAYGWFLGDNDVAVVVADLARGGCHDGLTPHGVNLNEGAESTLMWLIALEHVRRMRRDATGRGRREQQRHGLRALAASPG